MSSVPSRLPPPPPKRRAPVPPGTPHNCQERESLTLTSSETSGLDSGISESSSVSSLPLVTSSSALSSSPDHVNNNFSKLSLESDVYESNHPKICHSTSVVSLPADSQREEKSEVFSTSLHLQHNTLRRPPVPPVRKDSINSARKIVKSPRLKLSFEAKFYNRFHEIDDFPPPSPLSAGMKTYPTKESTSSSPPKKEEEKIQSEGRKKKGKKHQRLSLDPSSLLSRMMFGAPKTSSASPALKTRHAGVCKNTADCKRSARDEECERLKENLYVGPSNRNVKPPIAKKPILDRASSNTVLSPRSQVRPVCRSLSMSSPAQQKLRLVKRPAPPPPHRT